MMRCTAPDRATAGPHLVERCVPVLATTARGSNTGSALHTWAEARLAALAGVICVPRSMMTILVPGVRDSERRRPAEERRFLAEACPPASRSSGVAASSAATARGSRAMPAPATLPGADRHACRQEAGRHSGNERL